MLIIIEYQFGYPMMRFSLLVNLFKIIGYVQSLQLILN